MHYKLRILPNKGVKEVTGTVCGEPISMAEKEYSWPTQNPRIDLQYIQTADKANMGAYEGNWAIFQLLSEADKPHFPAPNDFGLVKNQTGRHSKGQNLLPDGSAITLEVTAFPNGVQRAFDKDFFRIGTCPGKATED